MKRRAALAGEIEAMHETIRKMVADLESLDATIIQFDLRQHDFHYELGTQAQICWRKESYHVDVHELSTCHNPITGWVWPPDDATASCASFSARAR